MKAYREPPGGTLRSHGELCQQIYTAMNAARPNQEATPDAFRMALENIASVTRSWALDNGGFEAALERVIDEAANALTATPVQEATRTVGDGELAKQLRAAATKNYRYGLPGGVSSLMLDAADALTAKPDPEAVTRRELVEALQSLEPYLDAIICYASTMDEYEPNLIVKNVRALLTKATRPASPDA